MATDTRDGLRLRLFGVPSMAHGAGTGERTAAPDTTALAEQLGHAQRELREVEEEAAGLPARLQAAAEAGDAVRLAELRRRQGEIGEAVIAARARVLGLRKTALETELASVTASLATLEQGDAAGGEQAGMNERVRRLVRPPRHVLGGT